MEKTVKTFYSTIAVVSTKEVVCCMEPSIYIHRRLIAVIKRRLIFLCAYTCTHGFPMPGTPTAPWKKALPALHRPSRMDYLNKQLLVSQWARPTAWTQPKIYLGAQGKHSFINLGFSVRTGHLGIE